MSRVAAIALTMLALAGCAAAPERTCGPGEQAVMLDQLYFGTGRPHGADVTPQEWSAFVAAQITPRFPLGFSLQEAQGQWRNADGSTAHELSHVLLLAHPDDDVSDRALHDIAVRYKQQFEQEAVLHLRSAACMELY